MQMRFRQTVYRPCNWLILVATLILALIPAPGWAGVIKVGMSTALSGPAMALGQGMKLGVEIYFAEINKAGGVHGNSLQLIVLDDGYEPGLAAPNMRHLIDQEQVLAVLGNVGTPTAIVTVPIAKEKKTLLFGAFSGSDVLRHQPPDRYVINFRASYSEELSTMIDGLLGAGIKPEEIAFFTQNDGYGDAGYRGGVQALTHRGYGPLIEQLAHGRYTRNTLNIEDGLSTILEAEIEPKAIIMVGTYKPCAAFIQTARADLPDTLFLNVSFVGSIPLLQELGPLGEGVIVTQVVPNVTSDVDAVRHYHQALKEYQPDAQPGSISLEGYLVAKIFVEGVRLAGENPSREGLVDAMERISNFDLGTGQSVSFSPMEHQASHKVWPTVINHGRYVDLDWSTINRSPKPSSAP